MKKGKAFRFGPKKDKVHIYKLQKCLSIKVCLVVCDNDFSQIFYNCSNVEDIFSWHN